MNDLFKYRENLSGPSECLGMTFSTDEARREHFLAILRDKLKDPAFRKVEGFPIASDEDILALSDPPYYTACPNPFVDDFIKRYGTPYDPDVSYNREPLVVDVQVGKTDALYKAHSYHTKVPHLAIVPSILHYTEPGDIVLDAFCGSGMTGVAAQWCGMAPAAYRQEIEADCKKSGRVTPKWGARRVVLNDLSPAATFIAANNNLPFDVAFFSASAKQLLDEVAAECGWMYETAHTDGTKAHIDYMVWSEIFLCSSCAGETVFYEAAYDPVTNKFLDKFPCAHCGAVGTKEHMELQFESFFDAPQNRIDKRPKRLPVLIKYSVGRSSFTKAPDEQDLRVIAKIAQLPLPTGLPTRELPDCQMTRVGRMRTTNTRCVHHMYLPRAARTLSCLWEKANGVGNVQLRNLLKYWLDSQFVNMSILNRYRPEVSFPYNPLTGVFYVPSTISEADPFTAYANKIKRLEAAFREKHATVGVSYIACGDAGKLTAPDESIDYIFTDPPFGENIYYADLNFLVESWHRVFSDVSAEAIIDRVRSKGLSEYQHLMRKAFAEYFRLLKPGRWMTVVFSNSRASVWNAIQTSLQQAGFVVANVSAMDKQQGSFKQVTSTTAVKQDLVISAYKPNGGLEDRFSRSGDRAESAWDFVRAHLNYLPTVKIKSGQLEFIAERDPRLMFDRLVSWFVRHNTPVPISSMEFQAGLAQRFAERDGMVFLPEQVTEYDKKRMQTAQAPQMELFVSDERSAIDWLTDFLKQRPSTYQEIHPEFIRQLGAGWKKHEARPELSALLEGNFFRYDSKSKDGHEVPSQIHGYLSSNFKELRGLEKSDSRLKAKAQDRWYVPDPSKAQELEKYREKALLKEFDSYKTETSRKLKEFRLEAMRVGFKHAWGNRDYGTIISVAKKIPEDVLQEDEKLLLWYDQAITRTESDA